MDSGRGIVGSNLPVLTDGNFSNWLFRISCILDEKNCKNVALEPESESVIQAMPSKEKENYLNKDARARSVIVQCISDKHIEYVKDAKNANEMINGLKKIFERKSTLSKLYIRRQLLTLKCKDENLQDHFVKFDKLIHELMKLAQIYHFMLDLKLQSSAKQPKTLETIKSEILTYTNAARNSTFLSKDMREFFLDVFGVTRNGTLTLEMAGICKACGELWEHLLLSKNLEDYSTRINMITLKEVIREYPKVEDVTSLHAYFGEDLCAVLTSLLSGDKISDDDIRNIEGILNLAASVNSVRSAEEAMDDITFGQGVIFLIALTDFLKRESYAYVVRHFFANGRGLQTIYAASLGSALAYGEKGLIDRKECSTQEMEDLSLALTGVKNLFTDVDLDLLPLNSKRNF